MSKHDDCLPVGERFSAYPTPEDTRAVLDAMTRNDAQVVTILEALRSNRGRAFTTRDLADETGLSERQVITALARASKHFLRYPPTGKTTFPWHILTIGRGRDERYIYTWDGPAAQAW